MKRVVYKYELEQETDQTINVGGDPKVLHCNVHDGKVCVWIEHDASNKYYSPVVFKVVSTCESFEPENSGFEYKYLNTVLANGGSLVLHVYYY